jgi:hypothetical protein
MVSVVCPPTASLRDRDAALGRNAVAHLAAPLK